MEEPAVQAAQPEAVAQAPAVNAAEPGEVAVDRAAPAGANDDEPAASGKVAKGAVITVDIARTLIDPLRPGDEVASGWRLGDPIVVPGELQYRISNGERFVAIRCNLVKEGDRPGMANSKSFRIDYGFASIEPGEGIPLAAPVIEALRKNDPGGLVEEGARP